MITTTISMRCGPQNMWVHVIYQYRVGARWRMRHVYVKLFDAVDL